MSGIYASARDPLLVRRGLGALAAVAAGLLLALALGLALTRYPPTA
jgi:hypothetical protein